MSSEASRDASWRRAVSSVAHHRPRHADRQRLLITRDGAQIAKFVEAGVGCAAAYAKCSCAQQGARCDAHRNASGIARRAGASATCRARSPTQHAPRRCRGGSTRSARAYASRTQREDHRRPPGARRSGRRFRRPIPGHGFDRGSHSPVHFGAVRLELGFICHRTNQRVVERILGLSGERRPDR